MHMTNSLANYNSIGKGQNGMPMHAGYIVYYNNNQTSNTRIIKM
jgi:hypothetical protein